MQGKDKKKKKTKTDSVKKKKDNFATDECEVSPAQNHSLADELALSLNFRKRQFPITLPLLLASSCCHELHPPTALNSQPQLTGAVSCRSPPPSTPKHAPERRKPGPQAAGLEETEPLLAA